MTGRHLWSIAFALCIAGLSGCDPAQNAGSGTTSSPNGQGDGLDDLRALRQVYLDHHDAYGAGPASWEAAIEFAKLDERYNPDAIERLRSAGYQVTWNAKMTDAVNGVDTLQIAHGPGGRPQMMISGLIVE